MRRIACLLILVSCASAQVDPAKVYESGVAAMVNGEVITVGEVRAASRRAFVDVSETARRELFERKLRRVGCGRRSRLRGESETCGGGSEKRHHPLPLAMPR